MTYLIGSKNGSMNKKGLEEEIEEALLDKGLFAVAEALDQHDIPGKGIKVLVRVMLRVEVASHIEGLRGEY